MLSAEICDYIRSIIPELTEFRRDLHRHPEIGLKETRTTQKIKKKLEEHGIASEYIYEGIGIQLLIRGDLPGDAIVLRADMDALPMQEETDLPFRSQNDGLMHACGHDLHTTFLLGMVMTIVKFRHLLRGSVKAIFQSGEETLCGAQTALQAGVLNDIQAKYAYAFHVTGVDVGKVMLSRGEAMAASDTIHVRVIGKGGHAAAQERTIDPIILSAHVVTAVQTLVARMRHPADPLVITFGMIHGGSAFNITPSEVTLHGTVRSFSKELRDELPEKLERVCRHTAQAFGGNCEVIYERGCPALISEPEMFDRTKRVLCKDFGADSVLISTRPGMGSEDFAFYTEYAPGMQIKIGTAFDLPESRLPVHNPRVVFSEESIFYGVKAGCALAFADE